MIAQIGIIRGKFRRNLWDYCHNISRRYQQYPGHRQELTFRMGTFGMSLAQFLEDRKGGVAPLLGILAIPLLGMVGAAVDYSRANSARTAMQAAADSTALLIVKDMTRQSGGDPSEGAPSYFHANFSRPDVQISQVSATGTSGGGNNAVLVSVRGSVNAMMLGVLGISTINLNVASSTSSSFDGNGCVLALDKEASGAYTSQGSTAVALNGCSLYDNSAHSQALTVGGSAKVSALSVGVVGGITPGSSAGLSADLGISTGISPVEDPYKDVEPPSAGACTQNNLHVNTSTTLDPGVYCGGIAIHSGATVRLNPGVYYLDGGDLVVNGSAGVIGNGVTLIFTSKNRNGFATAAISGNATVELTAPGYGPTAGIVMFGDRRIPKGTAFKLTGGASQSFGGAIYLPTATVNYSGGNGSSMGCTQLIGGMVNFSGNSNLAVNCSSYRTKQFGVYRIRLVS
jgi:Flp pilus assembly protein TadG